MWDGTEVLAVEVGMATGAKPPATWWGPRKQNLVRLGSSCLRWGWDGEEARGRTLQNFRGEDISSDHHTVSGGCDKGSPPLPRTTAFMPMTVAHSFSVPGTWQMFILFILYIYF